MIRDLILVNNDQGYYWKVVLVGKFRGSGCKGYMCKGALLVCILWYICN